VLSARVELKRLFWWPHLAWAPPIVLTAILEIGAILVFSLVARFSKRPLRTYFVISLVVLILTFIPDAAEPIYGLVPGATWPNAIVLMIMHVVAWAITVTMLFRLAVSKPHEATAMTS